MGIDGNTLKSFVAETKSMSYITKMSDRVLFMTPINSVRTISTQIMKFQFAVMGNDFIDDFAQKYEPNLKQEIEKIENNNKNDNNNLDLGIVSNLIGKNNLTTALIKEGKLYFFSIFYFVLFLFLFPRCKYWNKRNQRRVRSFQRNFQHLFQQRKEKRKKIRSFQQHLEKSGFRAYQNGHNTQK